jgi:acetyl/propionyl-CoA carboxylase alpha subunit
MNTRLQVEHPVTESITGVDMVAEQLRIAAGAPLRYRQEDIQIKGWAVECRLTAEDPFNDFLPATGRIIRLFQPSGPGIRVDSGIHEGSEVSLFYDPLLAKLVAWGNSREEAIRRMRGALREYRIVGVDTSLPFHRWVMGHEAFLRGEYDTSFLARHFPAVEPDRAAYRHLAAIAATLLGHQQRQRVRLTPTPCDEDNGGSAWRSDKAWKLVGRREAMGR